MSTTTKLRSGASIPLVGLGTWKSSPGDVGTAVRAAVTAGYRHIDTAYGYGNEKEIGHALVDLLKDPQVGITRNQLFVTTKLWNSHHQPADVKTYCKESLSNLQCDYIDLYLMHWPHGFKGGGPMFPRTPEGFIEGDDIDYLDTYKAMEELVDEGLCKHIGVSNFNLQQMKRLLDNCRIHPSALQVECHPYLNQSDLLAFCQSQGIALEAYSPLGSSDNPWAEICSKQLTPLLSHPELEKIAGKLGKTVAQVLIRFHVQRGVIVLPKSVRAERIAENLNVFDFSIDDVDMATIVGLNRNQRLVIPILDKGDAGLVVRDIGHKHYPFKDDGTTPVALLTKQ